MTGAQLREKRQAAGFAGEQVAAVAGFSSGRLRAIEHEADVDPETAARIDRAIGVLGGVRRRIARELTEAAGRAMRVAV